MRNASVSVAKAELSALLREVKRGERVIITDRGVPVAALVPAKEVLGEDERMAELVRRGIVIPPKEPLTQEAIDFILRPKPDEPRESGVLAALLAERASGY